MKNRYFIAIFAVFLPFSVIFGQSGPISSFGPTDFVDSLHFGSPKGAYAVLIDLKTSPIPGENREGQMATIRLLKKKKGNWLLIQTVDYLNEMTFIGTITVNHTDYNRDGLGDLQLYTGSGANGGNGFSALWLFRQPGKLVFVRGSDRVPNLMMSKRTHIIHGVAYFDGIAYYNYRLKNDSLVETGGIEVLKEGEYDNHDKYIINSDGKRKAIRQVRVKRARSELYADPEETDCF
jgi:hypothetical protein